MKKSLLLGIGLAASVASSYAQGYVTLDNYTTSGPSVNYGLGTDGTAGTGLLAGYTIGLYWGQGNLAAGADPTGTAIPTSLNASLLLGSGTGSTAPSFFATTPGAFFNSNPFAGSIAPGAVVTIMLVAYNGADYASTLGVGQYRGHSAAFQITTKGATDLPPAVVGSAMSSFQVLPTIPEPSTLALAGLGLASMLVARRRK